MIVYMEITQDEYALPVCCFDYAGQLAEKAGIKKSTLLQVIARAKKEGWKYPRFIRVEIDE